MKWILIILLLSIGVGALVFSDELESWSGTLTEGGGSAPDLFEPGTRLRDWGITPTAAIIMLVVMGLIGLGCCFLGIYVPMYDFRLIRGTRPRDGAFEAAMAFAATGIVWLIWLVLVYMYLPLGIALATFIFFCVLCVVLRLLLSGTYQPKSVFAR